jgi:hypothetical protein
VTKKRLLLPVLVALLAVGAVASGLAAGIGRADQPLPRKVRARTALAQVHPALIRRLRRSTWRWEAVIGLRRSRLAAPPNTRRALLFWRRHARRVRALALHPPHKSGWLCIHRFEARWDDSGDPYWGGLQMDRGFMRTYAPRVLLRRGWADRWTPLEQMWVAERAHRGRGYCPWPNTAQLCGLL